MKLPRSHSALIASGLAAVAALYVLVWISSDSGPSRPPISQGPQMQAVSPRPEAPPRSELLSVPQSTPVEVLEPAQPRKEMRSEPLPPVRVQALTQRYREIQEQIRTSKAALKAYAEQDPDLSDALRAKFEKLGEPLWFITLSQAFDDPDMRPALNAVLSMPKQLVYEMLDGKATKLGLNVKLTQARNPSEAASLLKSSEQQFQKKYRELLDKFEISDELAQTVENAKAGEILDQYLYNYMVNLGYVYSRENQTFSWKE